MLARIFGPFSGLWPLPLRIVVGIVFAFHGYSKIFQGDGVAGVAGFFGGMGIALPEISAWIVSITEFVGGICVILGLFTRYWAGLMVIVMIVSTTVAKASHGVGLIGQRGAGYELDLALLAGALALLLGGPGPLSIEKMLFRKEL